jgi:hypothetical protein
MTDTLHTTFSEADIAATQPEMKIGLLATVSPEGLPHLTMISSLRANSPTQMTFGQFTEGLSKQHIRQNPKAGWLIMTLNKEVWRGKATFTHTANSGPEYDLYNNIPMFRYNAYFGIHTVYFLDLVEQSGRAPLPMGQIVGAALQTMAARRLASSQGRQNVLNLWTRQLMNKLDNLKFAAWVGADGYPVVIPIIQAQTAGADRIIFSTAAYRADLRAVPAGSPLAVFGLTLQMEDVLMRGTFTGRRRIAGLETGSVTVDWVYNSMPPVPGQIYPPVPLKPVCEFEIR